MNCLDDPKIIDAIRTAVQQSHDAASIWYAIKPMFHEPECPFQVGERVTKVTGDYRISGEVRSVFRMANGQVRLVVEHKAEGGGSFLHIYSPANLEKVA